MLAAYGRQLQRAPVLTKSLTAAGLFAVGDGLAQRIERQPAQHWPRTVSFAGFGGLWFAPTQHVWFGWMERHVAVTLPPMRQALVRVCVHSAVYAPFSIVSVFGWMSLMDGRPVAVEPGVVARVWLAGSGFWIPTMLAVYRWVPLRYRVLVTSVANLAWTAYLSLERQAAVAREREGGGSAGSDQSIK